MIQVEVQDGSLQGCSDLCGSFRRGGGVAVAGLVGVIAAVGVEEFAVGRR
jgi:hypothetical protein